MTIQTDDFNLADLPHSRRVMSAAPDSPKEEAIERALRPKLFDEYVGQTKVREQLEIFIGAAKKRSEALDTCCCSARRVWAKPRSLTSLRMSWV